MENRQVETDISYVDLRKNGFKSIATLTTFMKEACQNALFYDALLWRITRLQEEKSY